MSEVEWNLAFDGPHATPGALNYRLPSWPPPDNFPVSIAPNGNVLSRFKDSTWNLSPYAGRSCTLAFGDGGGILGKYRTTAENGNLLRLCACWFMWGERKRIVPSSVMHLHNVLKPLFAACSTLTSPLAASDLHRFDRVVEVDLAPAIPPSSKVTLINLLHELYGARSILGFTLLTPPQIARLAQLVPDHAKCQTPFIPPRIWLYQTDRMRLFLEDFIAHRAPLEALFNTALDAYIHNYGEHALYRGDRPASNRSPFNCEPAPARCIKLGPFMKVADRYGMADLLVRWLVPRGGEVPSRSLSVQALAAYFGQVQFVGHHHLLNWSGMRDCEGLSLRSNCLAVEEDTRVGKLYSLRGETTKTTQDDDARWVTGPEAEVAVSAMSIVSRLRMHAARFDPRATLTDEARMNPYLVNRGYEPWSISRTFESSRSISIRPNVVPITRWRTACPNLFDEEQLRIQPEDERIARLVEPTLDPEKYAVGKPWNLSPHQYRRTALVTMASSGEVSLASQQLQAKHLVKQQTVYYNKGFSALHFNQQFAGELIVERYKAAARLGKELSEPHWVSPYGEDHKERMLVRLHHTASAEHIQKDIQKGVSAVRPTLFGVCTRRDRCPYGGWDNYVHCTDCAEALMDSRKRGAVRSMGRTIAMKLIDAPAGTPLRAALEGKAKAVEEFLHVTS